eukprot:scaffold3742_cov267-Chaetoceros_neogracile.AAC.5
MNKTKSQGSINATSPRLTTILGSFLEVLTHEILYTRSLYPHDAFSPTRHHGVACHACRHPGVVDYIFDTLKVSVPGIIAGAIEGLYIILYDAQTDEMLERYAVEFQIEDTVKMMIENHHRQGGTSNSAGRKQEDGVTSERELLEEKVEQLKRSLRDVLLKITSLDGTDLGRKRGHKPFSSTSTFKLCLRTKKDDDDSVGGQSGMTICPELEGAMREGTWFRSDAESCTFPVAPPDVGNDDDDNDDDDGGIDMNMSSSSGSNQPASGTISSTMNKVGSLTRPLKSVNVPSCGLQLQLLMEFPK